MRVSLVILLLCFASSVQAKPTFEEYLQSLKSEAREMGFEQELIEAAFKDVKYRQRAVKADNNQPEFKETLDTYLPKRVPQWKVDRAVARYNEHQSLLADIAEKYNVQARFIVAIWGMESNFGRITGNFPVMSALTTLAYDGRREAFFKRQVFAALTILSEGHITPENFKGSWAGASGQTQFMPSSFLTYAVDYDGDGSKDIWQSVPDVLASIANYLAQEGWDGTMTWGRQVKLPEEFDSELSGLKRDKMKLLSDWQRSGIRRMDGRNLPEREIKASLIIPDDETGRIYLVYENFHTLMKWNRSTYFGVSVGHMADRIKLGR